MADVKGGRGVTGMSFSGKGNLEKPSSNKLARELGSTFNKTTMANPIGRRYAEAIGPMKQKSVPRTFVPGPRKPVTPPPAVAVLPPAKKPVVKPAAKVISNVTREKLSPVKNSSVSKKPPATRFGTVTGKTTGTRVSGGGGYGGGGTRGGGSLSGQGSGSRSAGTSRTGGTQRNDPVRG
jgi:uncharacterized membrane protein YgcG